MAEFCKECYIKLFTPSKEEELHIHESDYEDWCESCGEAKPFVLYIGEDAEKNYFES